MMAGDSVASLKEKILKSNKSDPFMSGIKKPSDVKIFLPGKNGKPGKELSDSDVIPDGSSLDQPLVVKRSQDCCYKMGDDGQPDSIAMLAGDSVASLKEKILKSNKSDPFMSGIKKPSDIKIFLPGKNGLPGKELGVNDVIPDGSSLNQPLVVTKEAEKKQQAATPKDAKADDAKSRIAEMKRQREAMKAAAAAQSTKPRPTKTRSSEKKEEKPKQKVLGEEARRKCFMWYARFGQPNRDLMKRKVRRLGDACDITVEDVDALPWICRGEMLPVKELNDLIING
ncbi:expressed unknown protein [Seminavis robusta]|uniref:Uncharacterized protein n=1 Tax=Seminavis robusta TaxID=568900 RepID=A0A9N8DF16_9STRA|nr:expressed unknown protein [Seminavis robusta]|eukprot:Sro58_g033780.1 n/a (284) ;mRNA; r:78882-79733